MCGCVYVGGGAADGPGQGVRRGRRRRRCRQRPRPRRRRRWRWRPRAPGGPRIRWCRPWPASGRSAPGPRFYGAGSLRRRRAAPATAAWTSPRWPGRRCGRWRRDGCRSPGRWRAGASSRWNSRGRVIHLCGRRTSRSRSRCRRGTRVAAGEVLGTVRPTGSHCAACLHWGLLRGDVYLDPLSLLPTVAARRGPVEAAAGPGNPASGGRGRSRRKRGRCGWGGRGDRDGWVTGVAGCQGWLGDGVGTSGTP